MHLLKRALPLVLTVALTAGLMSPVAGATTKKKVDATKADVSSTSAQLHPFTSTEDLIRDAIDELRALGMTQQEKESDKTLVTKVERTTDMAYDTVKATLATELKAALAEGKLDVTNFGLTKDVLSEVMTEILEDNYLYNAVTNLTYSTDGGKVTKVAFDVTEGYSAAMAAMEEELDTVEVDVTDTTAQSAAQSAAENVAAEEEVVKETAAATFSLRSSNAGIATIDETEGETGEEKTETDGEPSEGVTESACTYHTVGAQTIGDFNEDKEIDIGDVVTLRNQIVEETAQTIADINNDGEVDIGDVVALRNGIVNEDLPQAGSGEVQYTWAEAQDYTPKFRTNEDGEFLDSEGNVTQDYTQAITNGGLVYNPQDGSITEGILADVYWKLTELSFTCSTCGEEIHIVDDPETEEDELANFSVTKDIYINLNTYETVACDVGQTPVLAEGETLEEDYLLYTDMQIAMYYDDSFYAGLTPVMNENGQFLNDKGEVVEDPADAAFMPAVDENGNYVGLYTSDPQDNGASEVAYYYSILSAFNADNAEYFGISSDYWTSKNSEANPMAALKVLCNLDPNTDIPPAQMIQMVQMLPQAFMAYVYYYGPELLAMKDAAMNELAAAGGDGLSDVQKLLVIHDWIAENVVFDMGSMLDISGTGGGNDPIQMTTFGALLSNQLTTIQNTEYYGGICLAYAAAYNYLVQAAYPEIYTTEDGVWCTPEQVEENGGDIVDFSQVMFYCDTAESSIAGEGFGGGAFNNVHYFNAVRLQDAPQDPTAEDNDMTGEWFYVDACYDDIYVECLAQYRAEAEGSVYHSYFLVSPQTMGKIWGDSIDYIDSLYDGYTYVPQVDEYGNATEISDNIAEDSPNYDPTHPEYHKVETSDEVMNNNTCYEDSWFSGAISKIYNDGENWYYVDSETNSSSYSSMMDEDGNLDIDVDSMEENGLSMNGLMHSNRVSEKSQSKLKKRAMNSPDWWEETEDNNNSMGLDMTNKEDTYATVIFDYGTGAVNGTVTTDEALLAAIEEDFIYNEQFPGLTHSIALNEGNLYFNLGNQIWLTSVSGEAPVLFREYNTVSASSDDRPFKASSYKMDAEGTDLTVENNPIAAICQRTKYTPLYDYLDAEGGIVLDYLGNVSDAYMEKLQAGEITQDGLMDVIVGRQFKMMAPQKVITVNVGTNYTFSSAFVDGMTDEEKNNSIYTKEAINYNPDYYMGLSEDAVNKNEEFLWCANIREDVSLDEWISSVGAEDKVPCTAQIDGHAYVYNTEEEVYICSACNLHAVNVVAEVENAEVTLTAIAESGMSEDFVNNQGGSSEEVSTTTQPVSPAREAATTESGEITLKVVPEEGYGFPVASYLEEGKTEPVKVPLTEELDEEGKGTGAYTATINKTVSEEEETYLGCLTISVELVEAVDLTIAEAENGSVTAVTTTPIQTEPENPETPETPEGGDGTEGGTEVDPETPEGGDGIEGDTEVDPEVNPDENEDETTEIAPTADLAIDEGQTVAVMVGDEVTVTAVPDTGYVLTNLEVSYTDEEGASQVIDIKETGKFIMPAADAIVTAKFEMNVTIVDESAEDVKEAGNTLAAELNEGVVSLAVNVVDGYELDTLLVDGVDVTNEVVEGTYEFEYVLQEGAEKVTVTVIFKAIESEGDDSGNTEDSGSDNSGSEDSGSDNSGSEDSGSDNSGSEDSGSDNSGSEDSGSEDSGSDNSGSEDSGSEDSGSDNSGSEDSGSEDSGSEDSNTPEDNSAEQ